MTDVYSVGPTPEVAHAVGPKRARSRFFMWNALALAVVVAIGFGPTLYLRPFFDVPEMPAYILIHGGVLTAWFLLFLAQTSLVSTGRTHLHRRIGPATAVVGVMVIVASAAVSLNLMPRVAALGGDVEADLARLSQVVWGNLGALILFSVLLGLAIVKRRRTDVHKRLMLLASITIVSPAFARIGQFPTFQLSESRAVNEAVYAFGGLIAFLLALVLHDVMVKRRVHPATTWGIVTIFGSLILFGVVVPSTSFGRTIVLELASF